MPVICPECNKEHGEKILKATDEKTEIIRVCENRHCINSDGWRRMDNDRRLTVAKKAGVGRRFIRDDKLPYTKGFPVAGLSWNESAYICGPVGTGKSWALSAIICDALAAGRTARFVNWQWFQLEVRDTYKAAGKETELDIIKRYALPDVLCLDDLGVGKRIDGKESEAARVLLYQLMDKRYNNNAVTHISSNMDTGQLGTTYDLRIARRIGEMCEQVILSEVIK